MYGNESRSRSVVKVMSSLLLYWLQLHTQLLPEQTAKQESRSLPVELWRLQQHPSLFEAPKMLSLLLFRCDAESFTIGYAVPN